MLNQLNRYFACLLLVLLPLQSLAATNISICNSMMQTKSSQQKAEMPHCNMQMADAAKANPKQIPHDACKVHCDSLCANLCGLTALPSSLNIATLPAISQKINLNTPLYASITTANLQRPPIHLS
jgi:hypothetical protein